MQNKRGQVTLFVIIAVVVVAVVILFLVIRGNEIPEGPAKPEDFKGYISDCVAIALVPIVQNLEYDLDVNTYQYGVKDILIFCKQTKKRDENENYKTCICSGLCVKTLKLNPLTSEEQNDLEGNITSCIEEAEDIFIEKGYEVKTADNDFSSLEWKFSLQGPRAVVDINYSITVSKEQTSFFDSFSAEQPMNLNIFWGDLSDYAEQIEEVIKWEQGTSDLDDLDSLVDIQHVIDKTETLGNSCGVTIRIYKILDGTENNLFGVQKC